MGKKEKMKEKMVSRIPLPSNPKVRYVRLLIHKRDFTSKILSALFLLND